MMNFRMHPANVAEDRDLLGNSLRNSNGLVGTPLECGENSLNAEFAPFVDARLLEVEEFDSKRIISAGSSSSREVSWSPPRRRFNLQADISGIKNIMSRWLYLLLLFIPLGIASHYLQWSELVVFVMNFVALLPLASLLGSVTEELALHTGDIIGGLLNATFGNAIEMIVTFQTLQAGLISVVQGTLLGSVISNLLLVLGMSFFFGGMYHYVQRFNVKGATCGTSLLLLSSISICIPTIAAVSTPISDQSILTMSRVSAIVIGITYCLFLFFQLYTHLSLFRAEQAEEQSSPNVSIVSAVILLIAITGLVAYLSEFLVSSITPLVENFKISEGFIGVILLPIVGNAAEHVSAVTVAIKNKVDLTMGIAVGSSVQVALFLVPFAVIVGWILNQPMTLAFSPLSAVVLILSVFVTTDIINDGESNWLEGLMLVASYVLVAVVFWFSK